MITMTMQEFDAHPLAALGNDGRAYLDGELMGFREVEVNCDADATAIIEAAESRIKELSGVCGYASCGCGCGCSSEGLKATEGAK